MDCGKIVIHLYSTKVVHMNSTKVGVVQYTRILLK